MRLNVTSLLMKILNVSADHKSLASSSFNFRISISLEDNNNMLLNTPRIRGGIRNETVNTGKEGI